MQFRDVSLSGKEVSSQRILGRVAVSEAFVGRGLAKWLRRGSATWSSLLEKVSAPLWCLGRPRGYSSGDDLLIQRPGSTAETCSARQSAESTFTLSKNGLRMMSGVLCVMLGSTADTVQMSVHGGFRQDFTVFLRDGGLGF